MFVDLAASARSAPRVRLAPDFGALLDLEPRPAVLALDMPIGLLDQPRPGGRDCDREARKILGRPRASSVFSPPARCVQDARSYAEVRGFGLTIESFHLMPKIRQVDRLMTPELQARVFEAHPELAFQRALGRPLRHNKKTAEGREERFKALETEASGRFRRVRRQFEALRREVRRTQAGDDDLLDAWVLASTAARIAGGLACVLPAQPPRDARGLRMEIWF